MPCYSPLKGFKGINGGISWSPAVSFVDLPMEVPCGQCIGCRLERSRQWAVRMMHEAQMHEHNCFITLTYDDDSIPRNWSLDKSHFQLFMKRLRKRVGKRVSFFHCGEYGDVNGRPHYHACLFGFDFPDRLELDLVGKDGHTIYESPMLASLWPHGFSSVGELTFESAAYCARYVLKKVNGEAAVKHYERVSPETGEVYHVVPEYCTMSLRPAIGKDWFARFGSDVTSRDRIVANGKLGGVPRYYDKLRGREAMRPVKRKRVRAALNHREDQTDERLAVREECAEARVSTFLKRSL